MDLFHVIKSILLSLSLEFLINSFTESKVQLQNVLYYSYILTVYIHITVFLTLKVKKWKYTTKEA